MKEPKFQFNDRVDFKDNESNFHVGYVKKIKREHRGWFRREWVYDICVYVKDLKMLKVFTVSESNIFGIVEKKEKPLNIKPGRVYKDFSELKQLINNNE